MKKTMIAVAGSLLLSGAAVAQMPHPGGWDSGAFWRGAPDSPRERIAFLQDRIDRGRADGSLDRHEADRASRELNGVRQWIHRLHWEDDGRLTPDQRGRVQARLDQLSAQIRWARHNGW